jgi:hypothetical protein
MVAVGSGVAVGGGVAVDSGVAVAAGSPVVTEIVITSEVMNSPVGEVRATRTTLCRPIESQVAYVR